MELNVKVCAMKLKLALIVLIKCLMFFRIAIEIDLYGKRNETYMVPVSMENS